MRQVHGFSFAAVAVLALALVACGDRVEAPANTRPPVVRPTPQPDGCVEDREHGPNKPGGGIQIPRPSDC